MVSIWIRIPKASIPLGLIYMIFMLSNRKTIDVHQDFDVNHESNSGVLQTFPNKKDIVSTPVEPLKKTLNPQPLTFDSEPIKKDIPIIPQKMLSDCVLQR